MHDPERGGSQIPLVICILLLLIAGFFAYNQYGEREAAEKDLNEILKAASDASSPTPARKSDAIQYILDARGKLAKKAARLEELKAVTGGTDESNPDLVVDPAKLKDVQTRFLQALDKGEFLLEIPVDRYVEDTSGAGGTKIAQEGNKVLIRYGGTSELRGLAPDLSNIVDVVTIPAMRRMMADLKRYVSSYGQAVGNAAATDTKYREAVAAKDAEIRQKTDDYANLENRKAEEIKDLRRQKDEAEAARAAAEEEKNKTVAALTSERNDWRKKAEQAGAEVQVLKQKKRAVEADTSPDGKVITADASQSLVVIDLGKANNNLMAGLNFEVYDIGKGGREIPKGTVKVTKVDATTASCTVLELFDAYNPIKQGDMVRSLIYNPREATHVALVGRFQKMGKSDAARRLQALGVIVDDKVTVQTTYLVVGAPESESQPIEETAEYKTATLYGIPLLSEKELSRLTMY